MPDYQVSGENEEGCLSRTSGYLERKQPKTCVWISAVVGRAFLQRSQTALANACSAGVDDIVSLSVADVQSVRPNGVGGIMVSNPPYGVRLEEVHALQALYPQLGT